MSKSDDDGLYKYSILIDLEFNGFALDRVGLAHVSDDDILLATNVDVLHLETQAVVNFFVAASISKDVQLLWTYTEPKEVCPDSVSFLYRFLAN